MDSPKKPTPLSPFQVSFVALMRKGGVALQEVEGIQKAIWLTFLINYALFGTLLLLFNGLLYFYLLKPWMDSLFGLESGSWAWLGTLILWVVQLTVGGIFVVIAFRLSVGFISMWHENLVSKVIQHFRPVPTPAVSLKLWLRTLGQVLTLHLKQLLWILVLLGMGFLPGIGLVGVFLLGAYLMGKDTTLPYLTVLQEHGTPTDGLKNTLRFAGFFSGISQMLLAFIPVFGWALVPVAMTYQVIGVAYVLEEARASQASASS